MQYTVVIIGAGQLGSRHLQGLKTVELDLRIEIVDPNEESLSISQERYNSVDSNSFNKELFCYNSIDKLSSEIDLAIIATSAGPRFSITEELLKKKNIKNILFEKVLFQKVEDYNKTSLLLEKHNINAWVNCPRRTYKIYKDIKKELSESNNITFCVSGGDWGLGCNSIHFIDCFQFICQANNYSIDMSGLDNSSYLSKRKGYNEFSGVISGKSDKGDIISLISLKNSTAPLIITIQDSQKTFIIDEQKGCLIKKENGEWISQNIKIPFQSQLTGFITQEILINQVSSLVSYSESQKLHLAFIEPLIKHFNKEINDFNNKICPIT